MQKKYLYLILLTLITLNTAATPPSTIGQRFILSLPETSHKDTLKQWLAQTKPGGVMLLASHFTNRASLTELIAFLRTETKNLNLPHLLITVDWEGGIVSRPNESGGFFSAPSPWALAHAGRDTCYRAGVLIGHQIRSLGADVNFAPSLDLFDQENHILATRCFSKYPDTTALSGIAFSEGLMSQGVMPVIKHFPGLGVGKKDTHNATTHLDLDEKALKHHMSPFLETLKAGIPIVMCTHAIHPLFGDDPITLSQEAVNLLKRKNKNALVITDDFSMKGVHVRDSIQQAALESLLAGYDMIIFSGKADEQIEMIKSLQELVNKLSSEQKKQLALTQNFVNYFKKQHLMTSMRMPVPYVNEKKLSDVLAQRCFQIPENSVSLHTVNTIALVSTNLPLIRPPEKWFIDNDQSYLGKLFEEKDKSVTECILDPKNPASLDELNDFCRGLDAHQTIVIQTFFYADNIWNTVQRTWLEALENYQNRTVVISLGHPLEQEILPDACVIHLGSFGKPLLTNAASYLCDEPELTGADRLALNPGRYLAKKKVGLLCHKCSVVRVQDKTIFLPDFIRAWTNKQHDGTEFVALFNPEHGLVGNVQDGGNVNSSNTSDWGCPIHSLHGAHRKPTPEMLEGLDIIVIDFQDVGVRCYTYLSTMQYMLESAAEANIPVLVLDRPNPLALWKTTGPTLDPEHKSFLGALPIHFLHGSTIGALAQKINKTIGAQLTVLDCGTPSSIKRKQQQGHAHKTNKQYFFTKRFIPPSPNLNSIDALFAYPLTVLFEGTNYSEGRGTDYPFLQIGAPWVDHITLARTLNKQKLPGVLFEPVTFTPQSRPGASDNPKHEGVLCKGVFIHIIDHDAAQPISTAQTILKTCMTMYPKESLWLQFCKRYGIDLRIGTDTWRKNIMASLHSS